MFVFLLSVLAVDAGAGEVLVDVLDVGQGDAVLVRGGGKSVLIDAGPREGGALAQLQQLGIRHLDLVVATHPHADHIGGMADVLQNIDVGLFLDNGMPHTTATYAQVMIEVEQRGIRYRTAERGLRLKLGDEAAFTVLFPAATPLAGTRSDLNSNSVVLWLDHGEVDMLFTGDAEAPTEEALALPDAVDVLKVAHHGSSHSSTPGFLARARPTYAIVSCGAANRYGHPDPEALGRLEAAGAMVYRTDLSGNLRVISDGLTVEVLEGTLSELERVPIAQRGEVRLTPHTAPSPFHVPVPEVSEEEARQSERQHRRNARRARQEER